MFYTEIKDCPLASVNKKFSTRSFRPSTEYSNSKKFLTEWFSLHYKGEPMTGPLVIEILVSCYADYDNYLKVIGDSLQAGNVIKDDREVIVGTVIKIPIKRGRPKTLKIRVYKVKDNKKWKQKFVKDVKKQEN